jgi:hypothetical protein
MLRRHNMLPERTLMPVGLKAGSPDLQQHANKLMEDETLTEMFADTTISEIVHEMQQLASRLLVKNQDLYGKYDRQMAEASVRMNISIPLTLFLGLAVYFSDLSIMLRLALTLAALAFGFILMRQGFLRAVSARDVIVQALVIGEVTSRHIPAEESLASPAEEPVARKEPMEPDQKPA